jgi:hypothetical protein
MIVTTEASYELISSLERYGPVIAASAGSAWGWHSRSLVTSWMDRNVGLTRTVSTFALGGFCFFFVHLLIAPTQENGKVAGDWISIIDSNTPKIAGALGAFIGLALASYSSSRWIIVGIFGAAVSYIAFTWIVLSNVAPAILMPSLNAARDFRHTWCVNWKSYDAECNRQQKCVLTGAPLPSQYTTVSCTKVETPVWCGQWWAGSLSVRYGRFDDEPTGSSMMRHIEFGQGTPPGNCQATIWTLLGRR